jgi:hypothetical protein
MANSHTLEDLLYEIHEKGLFDEVLEEVKNIRGDRKYISTVDLYEVALENILKKNFRQGIDINKK